MENRSSIWCKVTLPSFYRHLHEPLSGAEFQVVSARMCFQCFFCSTRHYNGGISGSFLGQYVFYAIFADVTYALTDAVYKITGYYLKK